MAEPAGEERLEDARRRYDALERGDLEAVVAGTAETIEWRNPGDAIERGTRIGREEFKVALTTLLDSFEGMSMEIVDSTDAGEAFALLIRVRARGRSSGAPLDQHLGQVLRYEDGVLVAFEWFNDPAEALSAIRASAWAGGTPSGS